MNAMVQPGGQHNRREPPNPVHYARDFSGGVNVSTSRESIRDNEAWWMEGLMPQGPGNLAVLNGTIGVATSITGESGAPSYQMQFTMSGQAFVLAIWRNSGNAWIGSPSLAFTKIASGKFTSGATAACQWNAQGILIVDSSAGYYDYNITTPSTLTSLSNSVQSITLTSPGAGYTSGPTPTISGGGGSGATAGCTLALASAAIAAGGTGYVVGDVLGISLTVGSAGTFPVTTVDPATGAVTAIGAIIRGSAAGTASANPVAATGGTGTGATFNCTYNVTGLKLLSRGSGYTSLPSVSFSGGSPVTAASATVTISGSLTGTAIAAFAGRAWIASGRGITFTDAGEYASFFESGSSFVIEDSYLANNITALYAANEYLYIFGDTSIDILSNVTVGADDTTNFSRVNVSASVGTAQTNSIFSYKRSVMFANVQGFWRLSGASPECVSEGKLDLLISAITFATPIYGAAVTVNNILCAAFLFTFTDNFVQSNVTSQMLAIFYGGRWFFSRQTNDGSTVIPLAGVVSVEANQSIPFTLWGFGTDPTHIFGCFWPGATNTRFWKLKGKLYDLSAPLASKQSLRAGLGATFSASGLGNFAFSIDTELGTGAAVALPAVGASGYAMLIGDSKGSPNNAKYLGFSAGGSGSTTNISRLEWFGFEYKEGNLWQ